MRKEEELLVALRRVIRAVDLRSKQLSKHVGLTGPQLLVMQNIQEKPGIMVREIAENINLSPATITNILDRLEGRDLATRIRSTQDKRKVGVFLTEKGKVAVVNAPRPLQEHFVERFSQLKEWEQSQMVATVQRIASMMDAEDIDASPFLELGSISEKPN
ncbi:MarR family transcriptional regulator [Alteromonas sp. KS69]|jgi:DNA-binding MarR family transcriptional regulator|uniref:Transcriptional regulator n=1 Tax=Alteromonas stellipolaris TaxID=233316 RepID=A0AAW7YXJ8_9ALTE|nr:MULTISPECIES: MarR family transcriptional regulator [Alteromonas]AMJ90882.1 transcriptional regulator [Alteromonas sp. Mac2]PHS59281.1 MAG: MarR family transcriptional regulator [Alteromonas sp.]ALM90408.1 Transcriptional regulator, MarR [Alteromonas stellipolaris LMG 21856]AMJ74586.1 transcriptional regulator [Alteromonas stellipolaris]AMJ87020.1 transcriptional regulator [Alteromonas sp. Mac1]|tara:strand:- start:286 stop:765 length:480 start_codon:yes stop_codon:yes gene_type:complete